MLGLRGIKKIEKMFACMEYNTTGNRWRNRKELVSEINIFFRWALLPIEY